MALSTEKVQEIALAIADIEEYFADRLLAVDREIRNLRERGSPITDLGDESVSSAADDAVATLVALGVEVSG